MRLKKITLENFRRYKHLEIDVHVGLTGIRGPNGSGKSSFLEGIFYGLTGQPLTDATKKDLVRWGEKRGRVSLILNTEQGDLEIERWIGREKTTLTLGETVINGTRDVNQFLEDLLPVPIDYLRDILFVAQEKLDDPLTGTEAARKDAFGKLFGCNKYERLRDILQEVLSRYALVSKAPSEAEFIALEEEQLKIETEIKGLDESLVKLGEERADYDTDNLQKIVHSPDATKIKERIDELNRIEAEWKKVQNSFNTGQINNWDRSEIDTYIEDCKLLIKMDDAGACPTCGRGAEKMKKEERDGLDIMLEEYIQKQKDYRLFDNALSQLLAIDNQRELLPDITTLTSPEEKEEAKKQLQSYNALENSIRSNESRKSYLTGALEGLQNKHKDLVQKELEAKEVADKLEQLTDVRDFLHRDALQQRVRSFGASKINEHLKNFTALFNIPYSVFFTEEGLMKFKDPDSNTEHDFMELSGGQKKLIALAYRLALMRLFVRGLNLAILDEPTAYIDRDNIEAMRDAFSSLDAFAKEGGMAIFIATHEPALMPVFPNILELDTDENDV